MGCSRYLVLVVLRSCEAASDSSVHSVACGIPQNTGSRYVPGLILLLANSASSYHQLKKLSASEACMLEPHRVAAVLVTRRMMRERKETSTRTVAG